MTEEEEKKAKQTIALAMLPEELLANMLPSVIWVDSSPCDLRITRRETTYHVEYVDYDRDGETVEIETEHQSMKIAIVRMLVKLMDMDEEYMLTYDDEVDGRVYLGEMTFTPAACGFRYTDPEADVAMGSYLQI